MSALPPALQTFALHKNFGGIHATADVSITIARGARHALIGPNGAGKTTLINLLTGVLAPTSGSILLEGEDITRLPVHRRARRGLVRTFQINQLFAELTPLETVAVAVAERKGRGFGMWRPLARDAEVMAESAALLRQFHLGDVMREKTAALPYGKRRLLEIAIALAAQPRVLLLDEPVAGVPDADRHEILDTVARLPDDVTVLLIEHDMDLVFSFARRISVLVNGALFAEGATADIARDPRVRAVYLGEDVTMAEVLRVEQLSAGYGEAVVLSGLSLSVQRRSALAVLGRNGTGKTTLINSIIGHTRRHAGAIWLDGRDITALRPDQRAGAGIGWVPQERNIFKSLTVLENLSAVARPGAWNPARVFDTFPRLGERKSNFGNQLSGGEQQMLAIGRALVLNPRLLLLDEPLEGLAPLIVEELLSVMRRIMASEDMAVIVVEQNARKILPETSRAIILERGAIAYEGDSAALLHDAHTLDRLLGVAR